LADPETPAFRAARRCSSAIREGNTVGARGFHKSGTNLFVASRVAFEQATLDASLVENSRILHHPIRANSGEPNGSAASGLPILDRMSDDLKADAVEQRCIFVRA
jgi:hypothetical protein